MPITVWCKSTWFSTEPSAYLVSRVLGRDLDRLGNGDAEAARRIRVRGEDGAAGFGLVARARDAGRAVGLHQRPPIGLLLIGDLDHVDLDLEPEQGAGEGERGAPLARAGLGRELRHAFLLVVEGLRDRGVGLVAAGRADALVFVEDARGGAERLLQTPRRDGAASGATCDRCRAPAAGSRCAARWRLPGRSAPSGTAARDRRARSGRRGRDGAPAEAASADRPRCCTRRRGIRSSPKVYLLCSLMLPPAGLRARRQVAEAT